MISDDIAIVNEKLKELQIPVTLTDAINVVEVNIPVAQPSPFKTMAVTTSTSSFTDTIVLGLEWDWTYEQGGNGKYVQYYYDRKNKIWEND